MEGTDPDHVFLWDPKLQQKQRDERAWEGKPTHYKNVRITGAALMKMVQHAKSGGNIEIMGLMQGKTEGNTFIIFDSFALPVEGTETRVNAGSDANEYMVSFQSLCNQLQSRAQVVGWYHSHPDYGCWLSGIDIETQALYQAHQDPFVAVVIDPTRTCASGEVDIGAFRTLPSASTRRHLPIKDPKTQPSSDRDLGYYCLSVSVIRSSLDDILFSKLRDFHWKETLTSSYKELNAESRSHLIKVLTMNLEHRDLTVDNSNFSQRILRSLAQEETLAETKSKAFSIACETEDGELLKEGA